MSKEQSIPQGERRPASSDSIVAYFEALKPRETVLLAFAGFASAVVAGDGRPAPARLLLTVLAVTIGSAGCNALTNYLDRGLDARMARTRRRSIPSGRIRPPQRILPLASTLVAMGLVIAWALNPWAFAAGAAGVATALVARKRSITHVPLGEVSSCAPVLIGWLGVRAGAAPTLAWLCALVAVWTPIHVWSLMSAYREDYLQAGVRIFPLRQSGRFVIGLLFVLALLLFGVSLGLGLYGGFGLVYMGSAIVLGVVLLVATGRLAATGAAAGAWRVYKLSAYPYLGLILCAACVDRWLALL